jgi:hypothetical protein
MLAPIIRIEGWNLAMSQSPGGLLESAISHAEIADSFQITNAIA